MYSQLKKLYYNNALNAFLTPATDEIKAIDAKMDNYLKTNLVQMILSKDDASFDAAKKKVIEDLKAMGFNKSYEFWSKSFSDAQTQYAGLN
jgi:hypothetical protein